MAKNKLSRVIFASAPVFLGLAILWNQASGNLYDTYIGIGAIILAMIAIIRESLR